MGELILKCETKFKKLTWPALISGCKTGVLHRLLIEFILFILLFSSIVIHVLVGLNYGVKKRNLSHFSYNGIKF